MAKYLTKYSVYGIADNLGKARLVLSIVKHYCENNQGSYDSLLNDWPDHLQGGKGVVRLLSEIAQSDERNLTKKSVESQLTEIVKHAHFNNVDTDEILVSSKNNLMVVNEGGLDYGLDLESAPNFDNRYTYEEHGKYHLETAVVKVSSFKLSDLFFQKDTNIEDLMGEGGEPYVFSKIHHYKLGELELEINANDVKTASLYRGWPYDC